MKKTTATKKAAAPKTATKAAKTPVAKVCVCVVVAVCGCSGGGGCQAWGRAGRRTPVRHLKGRGARIRTQPGGSLQESNRSTRPPGAISCGGSDRLQLPHGFCCCYGPVLQAALACRPELRAPSTYAALEFL